MHIGRDKTSESRPRGTDLDKRIIRAFPELPDETLFRGSVVEPEIWGIQAENVDIRRFLLDVVLVKKCKQFIQELTGEQMLFPVGGVGGVLGE